MKTFEINGNLGKYELTLPEEVKEISVDYLKICTDYIHPAPNYSVVAIVYKDSLSLVLTAAKKNKPTQVAIVPIFVKAGETESEFVNSLSTGDRCVIAGSDLSMGHHINSPYNKITPDNVARICEGDKSIYTKALTLETPVCFVEFKLVPNVAIHARLDETKNSFINPFIKKVRDMAEA